MSKSRRSTKAGEYLRAGNFVWNSGMFCFTAAAILGALEHMRRRCCERRSLSRSRSAMEANGQVMFDAASFADLPDISIDYAVMEKAANVAVIPCAFGWSDIGSWKAVAERARPTKPETALKAKQSSSTHVARISVRKTGWWRQWASKTSWSSIRPMRYS